MKIIGISGKKQAGKNTVANYINGEILKQKGMIKDFYIDEYGKLIVQTTDNDGNLGYGEFDVTRKDKDFIDYANIELWPYIKVYHFADPLKELSINLFDLDYQEIYGNDEQKNKSIEILWENMPENTLNRIGKMTNREFLEHFGTNIIRKIKGDVWSHFTLKKIQLEQSEIAIIPDVRFPNEVKDIKDAGGIVIRLTRNIHNSSSDPEIALDKDKFDWNNFDLVIDNDNIDLNSLCSMIKNNNWIWC